MRDDSFIDVRRACDRWLRLHNCHVTKEQYSRAFWKLLRMVIDDK